MRVARVAAIAVGVVILGLVSFFAEPFVAECAAPLRGSIQFQHLGHTYTFGVSMCPQTPAGNLMAEWTGAR
jgi:hypothetical protein